MSSYTSKQRKFEAQAEATARIIRRNVMAGHLFDTLQDKGADLQTALDALTFVLAATTTDAKVALGPMVRALHIMRVETEEIRRSKVFFPDGEKP